MVHGACPHSVQRPETSTVTNRDGPWELTRRTAGLFAELALDLRYSDGVPETVDMVVQFALNALDCSPHRTAPEIAFCGTRPRPPDNAARRPAAAV